MQKHKLDGFGKLGASGIFLWLTTAAPGLTKGFWGQFIYYCLEKVFSAAASKGLVFLNVGIDTVETLSGEKDFNLSMDEAYAQIEKIRAQKGALDQSQIKAIDEPVKKAFRKFADMSR